MPSKKASSKKNKKAKTYKCTLYMFQSSSFKEFLLKREESNREFLWEREEYNREFLLKERIPIENSLEERNRELFFKFMGTLN